MNRRGDRFRQVIADIVGTRIAAGRQRMLWIILIITLALILLVLILLVLVRL